jgi:hypothetical protein
VALGDINGDATLTVVTPDVGVPLRRRSPWQRCRAERAAGATGFRSVHAPSALAGGPGRNRHRNGPGQAPTVLTVIVGGAGLSCRAWA